MIGWIRKLSGPFGVKFQLISTQSESWLLVGILNCRTTGMYVRKLNWGMFSPSLNAIGFCAHLKMMSSLSKLTEIIKGCSIKKIAIKLHSACLLLLLLLTYENKGSYNLTISANKLYFECQILYILITEDELLVII